MGTKPV